MRDIRILCSDPDGTTIAHGFPGIHNQVVNCLADLGFIYLNVP